MVLLFLKKFKFSFLWTIIILVLLLYPLKINELNQNLIPLDKIAHFGLFFILASILIIENKKLNIYLIIYSLSLGITTEILQKITNLGRNFDFYDFLTDTIAVLLVCLFYLILKLYQNNRLNFRNIRQ